jgi:arylformamidase
MGIDASGIEPRSPNGAPYPGQPNHEALLRAGIPLIEYMTNLEPLINKRFLTFVLPLKVTGAEAFPVRVIAVEEEA